jgi:hypothetical protein
MSLRLSRVSSFLYLDLFLSERDDIYRRFTHMGKFLLGLLVSFMFFGGDCETTPKAEAQRRPPKDAVAPDSFQIFDATLAEEALVKEIKTSREEQRILEDEKRKIATRELLYNQIGGTLITLMEIHKDSQELIEKGVIDSITPRLVSDLSGELEEKVKKLAKLNKVR